MAKLLSRFARARTARSATAIGLVVGALGAVGAFTAVNASTTGANACTTPAGVSLPGSTFEGGDGNMTVDNGPNCTDWANVGGLNSDADQPSGSSDNSFGQGTKENAPAVTVVSGSIPPQKSDLLHFYEASEFTNGSNFLYLGWDRTNNLGSADMDFEINQNATAGFTGTTLGAVTLNRTAGDLLVTYDFGGSGTPGIGLDTWLTAANGNTASQCQVWDGAKGALVSSSSTLPCWGNGEPLNGPSATSTAAVAGISSDNKFGETAINLTAAGVFPAGTCRAFGSAFLKSRSSTSFSSEVKDFIAPEAVNISNCGSISITKLTQNGLGTFGFSSGTGLTPATFSLTTDATHNPSSAQTFSSVPAGTYTITETTLPTGWNLADISCTVASGSTNTYTTSLADAKATITIAGTGNVACQFTNHTKLSPTISTSINGNATSTVNAGATVHDTATLNGATTDAGGTVAYSYYTDSACTLNGVSAGTVNVTNGTVPQSSDVTLNNAGTYYFQAVYSGDGNNNGATSPCTSEQLVVSKASPTASTAQSVIPDDSFTLSGAFGTPGGTISFQLFSPTDSTCASTPAFTQTVNVSGNGTYSTTNHSAASPFVATTAGTWRWKDHYSGDSNNNPVDSACGTESFTIKNS